MAELTTVWLIELGERASRDFLAQIESRGFRAETISIAAASERLTHYRPHAMLLVLGERAEGEVVEAACGLARTAGEIASGVPLIAVGPSHQFAAVAELLRAGVADFILQPCSAEGILRRISVMNLVASPVETVPTLTADATDAHDLGLLPGESERMRHVVDQIRLVATRSSTVLITGESGTGKERVAQALHGLSRRSDREMVSVNCGGIPANLLEDEFFGHIRGAFTDAHRDRVGRFEQAEGSTIFLDEIGDMPLELQPKLLRALQEREIHRVGDSEPRKLDVRIVAATNVDLRQRVADGLFREDLYYRINVFPIHLPPLRERREDIPLFAAHFVREFCDRDGLNIKTLSEAALGDLSRRRWRGNIRELENAMEMAVIRAQDRPTIEPSELPEDYESGTAQSPFLSVADVLTAASGRPGSFKDLISQFEHELIQKTLEETKGNRSRAAECLGLKRTTLVEKLKKFELDDTVAAGA